MTALQSYNGMPFFNNEFDLRYSKVRTVFFPYLATIGDLANHGSGFGLFLYRMPLLTKVELPRLTSTGVISIEDCPLVSIINVSSIQTTNGEFSMSELPALRTLVSPKLNFAGAIRINNNNALQQVDLHSLVNIRGDLEISTNPRMIAVDLSA